MFFFSHLFTAYSRKAKGKTLHDDVVHDGMYIKAKFHVISTYYLQQFYTYAYEHHTIESTCNHFVALIS